MVYAPLIILRELPDSLRSLSVCVCVRLALDCILLKDAAVQPLLTLHRLSWIALQSTHVLC